MAALHLGEFFQGPGIVRANLMSRFTGTLDGTE